MGRLGEPSLPGGRRWRGGQIFALQRWTDPPRARGRDGSFFRFDISHWPTRVDRQRALENPLLLPP